MVFRKSDPPEAALASRIWNLLQVQQMSDRGSSPYFTPALPPVLAKRRPQPRLISQG